MSTRRLTFGSLFSGIGGFDLAFERVGMACRWQVEIDARCQDVLGRHWPEVEMHSDIRECGRHNLEPVDLVCGGFPCQDLSVAGRRAGLAGERSGLWFEFHRVLTELEPRWVVIENVPGLLSSNRGRDFATVIRGLVELGYRVAWRVLDAQYFGVAQRRRRVFIVGSLGDGRAAQVLFERAGSAGDTPPRRETGEEIAGSLGGSAGSHRQGLDGNRAYITVGDVAAACTTGGGTRLDPTSETFVMSFDPRNVTSKDNRTRFEPGLAANTLHGQGLSVVTSTGMAQSGCGWPPPSCPVAEEIALPLDATRAQAVAWNWQSGGDVRHNFGKPNLQTSQVPAVGVRRLTPTECERLQGFPDGWTAGQADSARYRQLGNAVAVPVVEWIGRRIADRG